MTEPGDSFAEAGAAAQSVDKRMLESLICPVTQTGLTLDSDRSELVSKAAKLAFPIRDGIPIMLVSEARALD